MLQMDPTDRAQPALTHRYQIQKGHRQSSDTPCHHTRQAAREICLFQGMLPVLSLAMDMDMHIHVVYVWDPLRNRNREVYVWI